MEVRGIDEDVNDAAGEIAAQRQTHECGHSLGRQQQILGQVFFPFGPGAFGPSPEVGLIQALVLDSAANSMMANILFETEKGSDAAPFSTTRAILPSWKDVMILMNFGGQPCLNRMAHNPFECQRPSSGQRKRRGSGSARGTSRTAKIMSIVPLLFLKQHWVYKMTSSNRWCIERFKTT